MLKVYSQKFVNRLVLKEPSNIPFLLKSKTVNRGALTRYLSNILPYRFGIEFECFGSLILEIHKRYDIDIADSIGVCRTFNISAFREDYQSRNKDYLEEIVREDESTGCLNEIRICVDGYKQLKGLFQLMLIMKDKCKIPLEGGGIHIHVDMSAYLNSDTTRNEKERLKKYLEGRLSELEKISGPYTGSYNKRVVGVRTKETWINISRLDTLEFRILSLTFDYETLLTKVTQLQEFVAKTIKDLNLKKCSKPQGIFYPENKRTRFKREKERRSFLVEDRSDWEITEDSIRLRPGVRSISNQWDYSSSDIVSSRYTVPSAGLSNSTDYLSTP